MRSPHARPPRDARGLTLIEALVGLALLAVLATSVGAALPDVLERRRVDAAAAEVALLLQTARLQAQAQGRVLRASFHVEPDGACVAVHGGPRDACVCPPAGRPRCDDPHQLLAAWQLPAGRGLALRANAGSIVYDPLLGTASPTATVQITGERGAALRNVVNLMGRVRTCAAAAPMAGHRPC